MNLLKTGLEKADEVINRVDQDMFAAYENNPEPNFLLVNTNKGNNMDAHYRMLKEGCVEIFSLPWMNWVEKIRKDDIVFLYANGEGIVAYGKGSGQTLKGNQYDDIGGNESRYQQLEAFVRLNRPIKAGEIHKILGKKIPFLRTLTVLKEGKKLLDFIQD